MPCEEERREERRSRRRRADIRRLRYRFSVFGVFVWRTPISFLMEEEDANRSSDQEMKTLQDCNAAIAAINTNLKAILGNLDHLSESIHS